MTHMKKQENPEKPFLPYFTQGGLSFDKNSTNQAPEIHGLLEAACYCPATKWSQRHRILSSARYQIYAVERTYNDLFGARLIVEDYSQAYEITNMKPVRESNMIAGKKMDDGYRGLHLYYQPDHSVYPIEFQFNNI